MRHPFVEVELRPLAGRRIAVSFKNTTDHEAHLYRPNACEGGAVENNVFVIRSGTARVPYTGVYVKRPAPTPRDFLVLAPHDVRVVEVDLATAYALSPGMSCTVRYEAFHDNPAKPDELWEVTSNTITLGA